MDNRNNNKGSLFKGIFTGIIFEIMEQNSLKYSEWQNASIFFNKIRLHTMQGFYGSPIHWGNKNYISFDILKIDGLLRQRLESPSKIS